MQFSQAFRTIMESREYTHEELAEEVGVSRQSVTQMLRKGNPSLDALAKYLRPLGYRVVLVPVGAKLTQDSYVVEGGDHA